MAIPALTPILSKIGTGLLSGGAFAAGANAIKNFGSKILGNSTGKNAAFAIGGFSSAELFDALGVQNRQFQQLTLIGLGIGLLIAVGQIFNIDLNL